MKSDQELYKRLRELPKEELWRREVPRFDAAGSRERMERVALIRAVGMIFSRFGTEEEKSLVREWLITLLRDPQEKLRRYALAALPKVGVGEGEEVEMLALLKTGGEREKKHLGRALEKVGREATLAVLEEADLKEGVSLPALTLQKVKAGVSRINNSGGVNLEAPLPVTSDLRVLLRCRRGLEDFVREEAMEMLSKKEWSLGATQPGCVELKPLKEFPLSTLYRLRCFATVAFPLGSVTGAGVAWVERLARCIASPSARSLLLAASEGTPRYRLEFADRGHQRGTIRQVIDRAYALCPEILNDARQSPWSVDVLAPARGESAVELRPRLYPDPRLGYRKDDIAAASHPPLAACMARLAGIQENETLWDPFCGSGLELIERSLRGGVTVAYGTDLDARAIGVAQTNFEAGTSGRVRSEFICCDFRETSILPGSVSLIITNPPLGRRVRIKDMQGLFADLYAAASRALQSGGRLVFVNPLRSGPADASLKLEYQKSVDLGGFTCRLEMYRKMAYGKQTKKSTAAKLETPSAKKTPAPAWWSRVGRADR
jgi:23S rRNA G2445 N2-methylase RlmL